MSDRKTAIAVRGLSKSYRIAHNGRRVTTVGKSLVHRLKSPLARGERETFWALRDVSFEVCKGDILGVIGRNGAGKSTLLKVLSRITEPTSGNIDLYGRLGSLLEVGTGFHPELTGRENVYLNGAILGMRKFEIAKQFDAIVDFADVEQFLDTPVKRYSSGMYVRLAFAVAAHLNPEILVVDEVLAVGDAQFQKKCLGKMQDVSQREGRTILFVSHNLAAVRSLCNRAIVLRNGRLVCDEDVVKALDVYLQEGQEVLDLRWIIKEDPQDKPLYFTEIELTVSGVQPNHVLEFDMKLRSQSSHNMAWVSVDILDSAGITVMQATPTIEGFIPSGKDEHHVTMTVNLPPLVPGRYRTSLWVGSHNTDTFHWLESCLEFEIVTSPTEGRSFPHTTDHGWIVPASTSVYLS